VVVEESKEFQCLEEMNIQTHLLFFSSMLIWPVRIGGSPRCCHEA